MLLDIDSKLDNINSVHGIPCSIYFVRAHFKITELVSADFFYVFVAK